MAEDLFFIPLIAKALEQPDPQPALIRAFDQIETCETRPRYKRGRQQFLRFMDAVRRPPNADVVGSPFEQIIAQWDRQYLLSLSVARDGRTIGTCAFDDSTRSGSVENILPGTYRLRLDTGLILWEGRINEREVLWTRAFPGEPLPMAADTGADAAGPTRTVDLTRTGILLRIYAGVEAGTMEIQLTQTLSEQ